MTMKEGADRIMTDEEKRQAYENMTDALAPRDKNGRIVPMTFYRGEKETLYYPYFAPNSHGQGRAIFCLEEFANGKAPADLEYRPGYQIESVSVDSPFYMSSIRYTDERLNLTYKENWILQSYHNNDSVIRGNEGIIQAEEKLTPDCEVISTPSGLVVKTEKGSFSLTNFCVNAVEHRLIHKANAEAEIADEYEVRVTVQGKTKNIVIEPKNLDNLVSLIQRFLPMCTVAATVGKSTALIVNHVREQLDALPERHYIKNTGFIKICGHWVFAHDGAVVPDRNVIFQTGKTIGVDLRVLPKSSFKWAMDFLKISKRPSLSLMLLLVAHLSPMFNLFEKAGHIPRFVTFINGRTGSLKTSVSLVIFRLFQEQPNSPEANFKDTEVALEIKLGEGNGKVVLLDDYRPPVTAVDGKSNLSKLESVIRAVGDRVCKSRSNSELGKAKEFLPTSCVVVTGEDLGGTQSSQLRMLVVPISKGDIDGNQLRRFQNDPMLISSHMYFFLKWAGENADAIIDFIRGGFDKERAAFSESLKEPRVIDTAVTLMLTAHILHSYGCAVGGIDAEIRAQRLYEWRSAILDAAIESEGITKAQNPVCMYLQAFFDMVERREVEIASDIDHYTDKTHIGYAADGYLWLWHREVYNHVREYWRRMGILFPLSCEKVNEHLASADLIKTCYEKRGDGIKRLFVCKPSLPRRCRLLALNESLARAYLESETE